MILRCTYFSFHFIFIANCCECEDNVPRHLGRGDKWSTIQMEQLPVAPASIQTIMGLPHSIGFYLCFLFFCFTFIYFFTKMIKL